MKFKKYFAVLVFAIAAFLGLSATSNKVSAAPYGAKLYTTPKVLRGTWHYKKGKTASNAGVSSKLLHPYSKIKITKHTIVFYRKAHKRALRGKYTFYKVPNKKFSIKKMNAAEKYATKHKWLAPYNVTKKGLGFSNYWLHIFESSACGELKANGLKMTFGNVYYTDTFRK